MTTWQPTEGVRVTISDAGRRLSDAELNRDSALNMQRIASSRVFEITAGAGLGGVVAALVWALVKPHIGA